MEPDTVFDIDISLDQSVFFCYNKTLVKPFVISNEVSDSIGIIHVTERPTLEFPICLTNGSSERKAPKKRKAESVAMVSRAKMAKLPLQVNQPNPEPGFTENPGNFIETVLFPETGLKSYSCKFCGLQKGDRSNLRRHILFNHLSNVGMVSCNLCEHKSKLRGDMKKHYMGKHKLPEKMATLALS